MITILPGQGTSTVPSSNGGVKVYTVGTTTMQLDNAKIKTVLLKADDDNGGNIYVCINNSECSSSNGFRLASGQAITLDISNLNMLYVVADTSNQKLYVVYLR